MHSHSLEPLNTKVFAVLHADSDLLMRKIIRNVFPDACFKLDSAANGKEAFALLEANGYQYDMVITEMYLQYANGYEIINKVMKESPRTKTIITSNMSYLHIREGIEIVREDCFKKPLVVGRLLERVKLILQQGGTAPIAEETVAIVPVAEITPRFELLNAELPAEEVQQGNVELEGLETVDFDIELFLSGQEDSVELQDKQEDQVVGPVAQGRPIFELLNAEFPATELQVEHEDVEQEELDTVDFDIELFLSGQDRSGERDVANHDVYEIKQDAVLNEIMVTEFVTKQEAMLDMTIPAVPVVKEAPAPITPKVKPSGLSGKKWW